MLLVTVSQFSVLDNTSFDQKIIYFLHAQHDAQDAFINIFQNVSRFSFTQVLEQNHPSNHPSLSSTSSYISFENINLHENLLHDDITSTIHDDFNSTVLDDFISAAFDDFSILQQVTSLLPSTTFFSRSLYRWFSLPFSDHLKSTSWLSFALVTWILPRDAYSP